MATTTNYSWTTPNDTDLVKDGAAAIRTLGSSVDTTVKNLNPGTTAGDIDYYTSATAKTRIAIGTAGQILKVNSGATAPEWSAAPAAGALTLVSATTFSAVASHSVNNVFTSSYKYYRALLAFSASGINAMTLRWRVSSTDNSNNLYYSVTRSTDSAGTNEELSTEPGTSSAFLGQYNSSFNCVSFDIFDPQVALNTTFNGGAFSRSVVGGGIAAVNFGGGFDATTAFDGMTLIASSGTITGTLKIYGYQN